MSLLEIGLQHCNYKYKWQNNKTNYNRWGTLMESKIRATMRPRKYENKGSLLTIFHITMQNCVHENWLCCSLSRIKTLLLSPLISRTFVFVCLYSNKLILNCWPVLPVSRFNFFPLAHKTVSFFPLNLIGLLLEPLSILYSPYS